MRQPNTRFNVQFIRRLVDYVLNEKPEISYGKVTISTPHKGEVRISVMDDGRNKEHHFDISDEGELKDSFWEDAANCRAEILDFSFADVSSELNRLIPS